MVGNFTSPPHIPELGPEVNYQTIPVLTGGLTFQPSPKSVKPDMALQNPYTKRGQTKLPSSSTWTLHVTSSEDTLCIVKICSLHCCETSLTSWFSNRNGQGNPPKASLCTRTGRPLTTFCLREKRQMSCGIYESMLQLQTGGHASRSIIGYISRKATAPSSNWPMSKSNSLIRRNVVLTGALL